MKFYVTIFLLITVMMLCSKSVKAAQTETDDYVVYLDTLSHIRGIASDVSIMTLSLRNVNPISGIQFDVTLPSCVTFGYPEMLLDDSRSTRSHSMSVTKLSSNPNKYRVLIASSTAKDLKGNDGPLVYMNILMSNEGSYSGNYYLSFSNITASESDETQHNISNARGLVRYGYIVGDANGDATVDIADYMTTASRILNNYPSPFYSDAANVDNIASIDVADLVGIANISLGIKPITYRFGTANSSYANSLCCGISDNSSPKELDMRAAETDRLYIEDFTIEPGETLSVPVLLQNNVTYGGLQTDLYLPDGLSVEMEDDEYIIDLTSRKDYSHSISCYNQSDGAIRVFISSMSTASFSGNSGAIMTIRMTASIDFHGPATIFLKNTICAEPIGTKHVLQDENCTVSSIAGSVMLGDVNGDGNVNISDVTALIDDLLSGNASYVNLTVADCNQDGSVNISDVTTLIDYLLSGSWN
jgi:hypothetical protein